MNTTKRENERHRRKRTVYHFAPLARFAARFRSTAPFGRCSFRTQQAAGNRPAEIESLLRKLPDDCSIEDVQYHLHVLAKVQQGLEAADTQGTVTQEEAEERLNKFV
ncbi:MAG: hypothetical protein KME13_20680 [Myxacorys californica WJT36-NPBG1]|jgi:hypothetical protein|nr:hypothetical protein [Myxacorys californica WJT36-NPBG1]